MSRNGLPIGAYLDEHGAEKLSDPDVEAALASLRFYPALNKGKPVESVLPVKLGANSL